MTPLAEWRPAPPGWEVPWEELRRRHDWLRALSGCPQDPRFHAEGDVDLHTRLACRALTDSSAFRSLAVDARDVVFTAALMHDVGKPRCTRQELDGRITSRGHSARGEALVRALLWRRDTPFAAREEIAALVRAHQVPFFMVDGDDPRRVAYELSQTMRCDRLALVAEADARGRRCADSADQQRLLDNVALFLEYCREQGCLEGPREFPSDHARFEYFRSPGRDPDHRAHDDTRSEVVLMSGLPGAGKDRWIAEHGEGRPVISLDEIRRELGVDPEDRQGTVIQTAREHARRLLRDGRSFIWNATNVTRPLRRSLVSLFAGYRARVRIVYVEAPERELRRRNRQRLRGVPEAVLDRLIDRWTVPDRTEAHAVEHHVSRSSSLSP